jgi:hypothetical protein
MGASVVSQTAELAGILRAKGLLADGKIVTRPASRDGTTPFGTDAARVRSIEWYLNTHHALGQLAPWFEGQEQNPFAEGKSPEQTSREILAALSLALTFRKRPASSISRTTQISRRWWGSAAAAR